MRFAATGPVLALVAALLAVGSAGAAPSGPAADLTNLRDAESKAIVDLYAADASLARARARLATLDERAVALRARIAEQRRVVQVGRSNLALTREALTTRIVTAFRTGTVDPLSVILAADSLTDAIDSLQLLTRVSARDTLLVTDVSKGLSAARRSEGALERARRQLNVALEGGRAETARLAATEAQRAAVLSGLREQEHVALRRIAALEAAAEAAARKSRTIQADTGSPPPTQPPPATGGGPPDPPPPPAGGPGTRLTVVATAYAIHGTTATGIQTRRGICATDPRVIPMGTSFDVPGYGGCVAADTGGAIKGNRIDVWVATETEAENWGVETVTITIRT